MESGHFIFRHDLSQQYQDTVLSGVAPMKGTLVSKNKPQLNDLKSLWSFFFF